jgi:hypothetical protein
MGNDPPSYFQFKIRCYLNICSVNLCQDLELMTFDFAENLEAFRGREKKPGNVL